MANICEKCTHRNVCRYQEPCEECNQFAEEVVRCKACVHSFVRYGENETYCGHPDGLNDRLIDNGVTIAKWIPVTERLPEYEQQVLTYRGESGISIERMFPGAFWDFDYDIIDEVTHWMPLPEPPKGE